MTVFISGSRSVKQLDECIIANLRHWIKKNIHINIGDCYGLDLLVQSFLAQSKYKNVTVYATNGKVRNNVGNWEIKNITSNYKEGTRDYYTEKDIAMSNDSDYAFVIWDGVSKGSYNNIVRMIRLHKIAVVYEYKVETSYIVQDFTDFISSSKYVG